MKLAVIGTRTFKDKSRLYFELKEILKLYPDMEIVSGVTPTEAAFMSEGADKFAAEFAKDHNLKYKSFPADWDNIKTKEPLYIMTRRDGSKYNALAGKNRNTKIAEYADHGIVFWDGKSTGTKDTKDKMQALKKYVKWIKY